MAAWRAVVRVLRSPGQMVLKPALDTLSCAFIPGYCRVCEEPLLHFSPSPICFDCWQQIPPQNKTLCSLCGEALELQMGFRRWQPAQTKSFGANESEKLCEICEQLRPAFVHAAAHGAYEDTLRALIHLFKYEKITALAEPLGRRLAETVLQIPNLPAALTVVAVPLHAAKERQRGFNQSRLLAEAAVRVLRRESGARNFQMARHGLVRQHATESQTRLTGHERRRNLRGAFFVAHPQEIFGRNILLLDDIYTTGATARECSRTLMNAGATAVYVATLARSQREGVALWEEPVVIREMKGKAEMGKEPGQAWGTLKN